MLKIEQKVRVKKTGETGMVVGASVRFCITYQVLLMNGYSIWYGEDEIEKV
jgi:hypothetical protein